MFLASDKLKDRERKVRKFLRSEPGIALLLAAVNFEWTVTRAVLFLSRTPNAELREKMTKYYSLKGYEDLWKNEILTLGDHEALSKIVRNWSDVKEAFRARNVLVQEKTGTQPTCRRLMLNLC